MPARTAGHNEKDAKGDHHSFYGFVHAEIKAGRAMFRR
jgi:hypothetical protein